MTALIPIGCREGCPNYDNEYSYGTACLACHRKDREEMAAMRDVVEAAMAWHDNSEGFSARDVRASGLDNACKAYRSTHPAQEGRGV